MVPVQTGEAVQRDDGGPEIGRRHPRSPDVGQENRRARMPPLDLRSALLRRTPAIRAVAREHRTLRRPVRHTTEEEAP